MRRHTRRQRLGMALFAAGFLATQVYFVVVSGWVTTVLSLAVVTALVGGYHLMGGKS
ncbi:hypothetical protein ACIOD2_32270 [Amycolatopsis sp. NPDC088138]|uniref:hypothetical protein n=1 Tax=Amycolatopsis sp. NPDC088138 TaxID=3363938 RepID=UPI003828617A